MLRLNSQVWQFGGLTPGRRVRGRDPKMPIGAAGSPHFADFANPTGPPETKTHNLLGVIRQISETSLGADFNGILNLRLNRRFRHIQNGGFFSGNQRFIGHESKARREKTSGCDQGLP